MLGRHYKLWLNSQSRYIELESLALSFRILQKRIQIEYCIVKLFLLSCV